MQVSIFRQGWNLALTYDKKLSRPSFLQPLVHNPFISFANWFVQSQAWKGYLAYYTRLDVCMFLLGAISFRKSKSPIIPGSNSSHEAFIFRPNRVRCRETWVGWILHPMRKPVHVASYRMAVIYLERGLFGAPMWIRLWCGFGLGLLIGGLEWIYG